MRYIILFILVSNFAFSQSITDYNLGDNFTSSEDMIFTRVGNLDGVIFIYTDDNDKIISIGFVPSYDGFTPRHVEEKDFRDFMYNLRKMYSTDFDRNIQNWRKKHHYVARLDKDTKLVVTIDDFTESSYARLSMMINRVKK
ncbi:hypothetical protein MY04_2021 [Flammeovirga sp. MY04]|uniref:hypothetical protein n=1 Tax=Flammeovirga sp. MY04 TaxID=1191459 RepID=UPI00080642E9|nr:hypothetical protein [Flammeovirga sp. MY04]ANQ49395.1 hypothetical protein MY04_2021 [Flammeovirga sp. MY04]